MVPCLLLAHALVSSIDRGPRSARAAAHREDAVAMDADQSMAEGRTRAPLTSGPGDRRAALRGAEWESRDVRNGSVTTCETVALARRDQERPWTNTSAEWSMTSWMS